MNVIDEINKMVQKKKDKRTQIINRMKVIFDMIEEAHEATNAVDDNVTYSPESGTITNLSIELGKLASQLGKIK